MNPVQLMLNILLYGGGAVLLGITGMAFYRHRLNTMYPYEAEIYERDNLGHLNAMKDRFGRQVNKKSNMELGRFKKSKGCVGLENFNFQIIRTTRRAMGLFPIPAVIRRVSLLKIGDGQFMFLKPDVKNPDGIMEYAITRADVDWAVNSYIQCVKTYNYKDRFKEMAPLMILAVIVIGIVIVSIMLIRQFEPLTTSLKESAATMAHVAENLKAASFAQSGVVA